MMMERGRWQTPQQLIRRQKSLFHVELGLSAPSLCIPISLSSISLYKETFSSSASSCEWCVCVVWAPPALECGMHRRRPLEASFSVSTCAYVFVGCLHSVSYTWPRRAYLSFPDQFNPKESKKKKKRKKVSTFLSFFLVPSVVWLPPSLQGLYSAALCAMSISNCVFFPSSSFFHPFRQIK